MEQPAFFIETVTEKTVERLPAGPLYWRIENFPSLAEAQVGGGPTSLAADVSGKTWLFTLGLSGEPTPGGTMVAEIGPVPIVAASQYLLRVNHAGGPPGATTPVHSHPGSEAFYVLAGQLSQKTRHGVARLDAGRGMNGHEPSTLMQLASTGSTDLDQLVMFVVDATKPFSSPASFE